MKKELTIISVLLLLSAFTYASDSTRVKSFKRVYVGVSFTPNVTYRYLKINHTSHDASLSDPKSTIRWRNEMEKLQFGFQAGIRFGVKVTRFLNVEMGLEYSLHRYYYYQNFGYISYESHWNGDSVSYTYGNFEIRRAHKYHYINLPFAISFTLGKHKVKAIISAGINLNFLVEARYKSESFVDGEVLHSANEPNKPYSKFNLSPFIGIGIDYQATKCMFLRIMPTAQLQTLKNSKYNPVNEYLWSTGINTSLFFGFTKAK